MKNKQLKSTKRLFIGLFFMVLSGLNTLEAQEVTDTYYTVSGVVRDAVSRRALSFVDVLVTGTNIATVTNQDGYFLIKIDKGVKASEVMLHCMGYQSVRIAVNGNDLPSGTYLMIPSVKLLDATIVEGWDADRLVEEAVARIEMNYSNTSALLTGFYRETIQKGRRFIDVSEAVMNIYKTSYSRMDVGQDRVQILKGRKLVSVRTSDTLGVRILGGPNIAIFLDVVKNVDILLDDEARSQLRFTLEPSTVIDDKSQFVVRFDPGVVVSYALNYGKLYIDKATLAFTRAEFYLDMSNKDKVTQMILRRKPAGLRFNPEEVYVLVNYKQQEGKTYLSYIRNEIKFSCDWKRRLFATNYTATSEMVVTERAEEHVVQIPRGSAFGTWESLSNKVMNFYDEDFWGAYNIIEPTESLESAVSRLRRQAR
ncbi:MAG: carboxypeptidase-like regulatory domain-containing protein [Bacteroidetes bacterium]|nr:carboxypeptidase-like regulatory domain-containing protein [Bacteroidota bacterium]